MPEASNVNRSSKRMSREVRAAEPIHVTHVTVALAALGFLLWGIAYLMLWKFPTETRFEWIIGFIGPLLIAAAALNHIDHHKRRFGSTALVLFNLGFILSAVAWLPYALDPSLLGQAEWTRYVYVTRGLAWIAGTVGVLVVIRLKKDRLAHSDKSAESEIHATFFQLWVLAFGMLIYGISTIGIITDRFEGLFSWLTVLGPVIIAIAIIAHLEHLTLRIGIPAVALAIIGAIAWAAKNYFVTATDLIMDPNWTMFMVYGWLGVVYALGAASCLLVLFHKRAWEAENDRSNHGVE
jgi:hypothetical protein